MLFQYFLPTRIVFGRGSAGSLPEYLQNAFPHLKSIFVVTGRGFLWKSGIRDRVLKMLEAYDMYLFDEVESGPTAGTLESAIAEYKKSNADIVVAVGGGSVMDLGKAVAILSKNTGKLAEYQSGKKPLNEAVPYVAIPTTIGTASEMTVWSVIINYEGPYAGKRKSFEDPKMYPKLAVIDPDLSLTLPPKETAATALDILCASVESIWSKKRNPISTIFALEAIKLAVEHLPRVCSDPGNPDEREQLCLACLYSGFAVSNSRTGMNHKVSYPLTSYFKHPHGAACALTLPYFLEFIGEREPSHLVEIVRVLGVSNYREAAEKLRTVVRATNMPTTLGAIGVKEDDIVFIAKDSYVPVEKQEDPVPISFDDLVSILTKAL